MNEILIILIILFFGSLFLGTIVYRILMYRRNRQRVYHYIEERGGVILDCAWDIRSFGFKNSSFFDIRYKDREGQVLIASARSGWHFGVTLADERILEPASSA